MQIFVQTGAGPSNKHEAENIARESDIKTAKTDAVVVYLIANGPSIEVREVVINEKGAAAGCRNALIR